MTVYIVTKHVLHEGFDIIGVFSSREKAHNFLEGEKEIRGQMWYEVDEWFVDEE